MKEWAASWARSVPKEVLGLTVWGTLTPWEDTISHTGHGFGWAAGWQISTTRPLLAWDCRICFCERTWKNGRGDQHSIALPDVSCGSHDDMSWPRTYQEKTSDVKDIPVKVGRRDCEGHNIMR